jgi:CO/xanthine dehydrogenase FAD-binding subunit
VGVACVLQADPDGVCTDARLVLTGVGATPYVSTVGQQVLQGAKLSDELLVRVEEAIANDDALEPDSDIHASSTYRKEVGGVMAKRALRIAYARLGNGASPS